MSELTLTFKERPPHNGEIHVSIYVNGQVGDIYVTKRQEAERENGITRMVWNTATIQNSYRLQLKHAKQATSLIAQLQVAIQIKQDLDTRYPSPGE